MRASHLVAPALLLALAGAAPARAAVAPPATPPVMTWIDDDYAKARTQARQRKLPIFVESWAPW
jgi:hypothetical protein